MRKCKIKYYNEILIKYKNDSRKTWSVLNQIIKKNNNTNVMSDIFNIGNKKEDNPNVISNEFCKYVSEVGNKFASKIPKSKKPFSDHLQNINPHSMFFTPTDCEEVYKIIMSLKPKNSHGHDKINSKLINKSYALFKISIDNFNK